MNSANDSGGSGAGPATHSGTSILGITEFMEDHIDGSWLEWTSAWQIESSVAPKSR